MSKPEQFPVFLKGVHIQGFKSFADRVKFELGHGLSVIVGPNGSGKSNVADAVRWVLGEQSAKSLRGAKMEDVIFAGSTQRRPVGMAEVSLIFDNTTGIFPLDFQEITVTRRVYRDGEGQYLLNKVPCRLKDIQELFMDTGAGKEGFSIIGQGRVEEILNLKSEERRSLIEEAAGITKFRMRKRESLKRLDDTVLNLQRLEDILQEIEGQLIPLAAQAQVAEQSLALSAEQKQLEIQGVVLDLFEVKQKLTKAHRDSETLQTNVVQAQASLSLKESKILEEKFALKKLDDEIQHRQEEAFQAEQALNTLKHERNLRTERYKHISEQSERLAHEIDQDDNKIERLHEKIETLAAKKAVLKLTVQESEGKVLEYEQKLNEVRENNHAKHLEVIKSDLFQALSEQASCANELTGVRQTLASLEKQALFLQQEQESKESEHRTLVESSEANAKELEQLTTQIKLAEAEVQGLKAELSRLKRERQETNQELQKHRAMTNQTRARLQALQALEDSLEGYQRGVREVMLAKKKEIKECSGLCGTVADLISVDENYEIALEIALGAGLQNVVTENEQSAKQAINYLKAHQFGRVTFLPLDVIQGNKLSLNKMIEQDPGYIGIAVDLARFDEKYRPAIEFLLGRIVVVADMDSATRIARASGYKLRIVTLEGDQVHPGGSLSGGSIQRRGGNLLARSREIEDLHTKLKEFEQVLAEREREFTKIEQAQWDIEQSIDTLSMNLAQNKEREIKLRSSYENVLEQIRRLTGDILGCNLRNQDNQKQREEYSQQLQTSTERLEIAEAKASKLREEFNQLEQAAKLAAGEIEAITEHLTQERVQLAKWGQELLQCSEQMKQERSFYQEKELSLRHKRQEMIVLQRNCQDLDNELKVLSTQVETDSQTQETQQYDLMQRRVEREDLSARVLALEQEIQVLRQGAQSIEQRLHANEIRVARLEAEYEAGETRLAEEFSLSWDEAKSYQVDIEKAVLWQRVQDIKRQIEELGPVNQAAIEEYPKLRERREFMLAQRNDLVEADRTLRQLISELDKTMCERFGESFKAVNEAFIDVFKELFDGGKAELILVDPEHLLETGVEIVAQPPGKKPQLLSLLSGGERALTAIALLFALLRVKPSPFCILDEIEASLDDANVQRFAQYIHRLSDSTQFVVISHRKGTMESADVLYGITMEESGVSKLLSVQLDERQDTIYTA